MRLDFLPADSWGIRSPIEYYTIPSFLSILIYNPNKVLYFMAYGIIVIKNYKGEIHGKTYRNVDIE